MTERATVAEPLIEDLIKETRDWLQHDLPMPVYRALLPEEIDALRERFRNVLQAYPDNTLR